MKEYIVKALKWALSKFDDKPAQVEAWPFPVGQEPQLVEEKTKPRVSTATTRSVKKAPAAKRTAAKKAK